MDPIKPDFPKQGASKLFMFIVIVLAAVIIGGGIYYYLNLKLAVFENEIFTFQYPKGSLVDVNRQTSPGGMAGEKYFKYNDIQFAFINGAELGGGSHYILFDDLLKSSPQWGILLSLNLTFPDDLEKVAKTLEFTPAHKEAARLSKEASKEAKEIAKQKEDQKAKIPVKRTSDVAPTPYDEKQLGSAELFDDCPGLANYSGADFYPNLLTALKTYNINASINYEYAENFYVADACYSKTAQKVILLAAVFDEMGGGNFGIVEYDIANNGVAISRWPNNDTVFPVPAEFGARNQSSVGLRAFTCIDITHINLDDPKNYKESCLEALYNYDLVSKDITQIYNKRVDPTPEVIKKERERRSKNRLNY